MPHKKSKLKVIKALFKLAVAVAVLGIIAVGGIFAYYAKDLPSPGNITELKIAQSTKIYDRTGANLLYDIHGEQKRTIIPLADIPPHMKIATIMAEDDRFYEHSGVDLAGIARAVLVNLKGKTVLQGGSTITQQLIKNIYFSPERTLSRKIKEIILALEMEVKYSKDEILSFYLNIVPYGSSAYGVEAASLTFFGKHAKDLTLAQSALLASLPKAPTYYSPFGNNPDKLKERQEYILRRMHEFGYITDEHFAQALEEEIVYFAHDTGIEAPHFVMYVREYLEKTYGESYLKSSGLTITTTLDWDLQQEAERIVAEWGDKNEKRFGAKNAALVAIDPSSGQILAMVGSRDYFNLENDGNVNVATRLRQPGSSFKPFAYARAFQKGYTPDTLLFDVETNFGVFGAKEYVPRNYDGKFRGPMTMKDALAQSINIPAVKTLYLAGVQDTIKLAHAMGITTLTDPSRYGLSLVLGGGEVTLLEETSAYGVFSQEGIRHVHTPILSIASKAGDQLEAFSPNGQEVLDPEVARAITSILSDNALRAPIFGITNYLTLDGIPSAVKTGTTQEYRDAWTIGYTPDLVVGVWVGNNDNSAMHDAAGVKAAAPIWHDFMNAAHKVKGWTPKEFTAPKLILIDKPVLNGKLEGTRVVEIDSISKKRATEFTPKELIEKQTFSEPHSLLYYVQRDNPRGAVPENPSRDPQFTLWEEAVQKWARASTTTAPGSLVFTLPPQEYDDIHTAENIPRVSIVSPRNGDLVSQGVSTPVFLDIENTFPVTRVEIFLDVVRIAAISSLDLKDRQYTTSFQIPKSQDTLGARTLTIRITDTMMNVREEKGEIYVVE